MHASPAEVTTSVLHVCKTLSSPGRCPAMSMWLGCIAHWSLYIRATLECLWGESTSKNVSSLRKISVYRYMYVCK